MRTRPAVPSLLAPGFAVAVGLALAPESASAFCGTYVGTAGASLKNDSSQVILARRGNETTLTLVADVQGDASDFTILLPIPQVVGPDDVTTSDPSLISWLSDYSPPREVTYTCDDAFDVQQVGIGCTSLLACGAGSYYDSGYGVTVENSFSEAGYDLVVLSAEQSSGLFAWLDANGYSVPTGGETILQEYIDAGAYFLAVKVSLGRAPSSTTWLPPLQIRYHSDVFALPIRIGTISADGPQEDILYILTDVDDDGKVGISNYPEVEVGGECMWKPQGGETLASWYDRALDTEIANAGGAGWIEEYSADLVPQDNGQGYHCDPCTATPAIPGNSFGPLGFPGDRAHLTRLRVRYTPATATRDLNLYVSGITGDSSQLRFVRYDHDLEFLYPICEEGWASNPGQCPDDPYVGCSVPPARTPWLAVALAATFLRRRSRA